MVISVKDFGAMGNGSTIDTDALKKAFASIKTTGETLHFPSGTYLIDNTIGVNLYSKDKDIGVICDPSTIIKATKKFPVDKKLFNILGSEGSHSVSWTGGTIDGRLMPSKKEVAAPDCLTIAGGKYINKIYLSNLKIIQNDSRQNKAGDSCLFISGNDVSVTNCIFQGAVDAGIYLSGSPLDNTFYGERFYMSGCTFIECEVGFISKRMYKNHIINGNFFKDCNNSCVVGGGAGTPLRIRGGKTAIIANNIVENCLNGIELRDSDNSIILGNIVTGGTNFSYRISGSQNCVVSSNVAADSEVGINLKTLASDNNLPAFITKNTLIMGNSLNNHKMGIQETVGVLGSTISNNIINK